MHKVTNWIVFKNVIARVTTTISKKKRNKNGNMWKFSNSVNMAKRNSNYHIEDTNGFQGTFAIFSVFTNFDFSRLQKMLTDCYDFHLICFLLIKTHINNYD